MLVARVADLAAEAEPPDGVAIREVFGRDDLRRIGAMEEAVWDDDHGWMEGLAKEREADPEGLRIFVAEAGDTVVSAGWIRFPSGTEFGTLWGGATLPEWRGRGIYRALVAVRAQTRRRARLPLPRGGRLRRQPPDPRAARLRPGDDHDAVRLVATGIEARSVRPRRPGEPARRASARSGTGPAPDVEDEHLRFAPTAAPTIVVTTARSPVPAWNPSNAPTSAPPSAPAEAESGPRVRLRSSHAQ